MNLAILPADRREIIAGARHLCEGGAGNCDFGTSRFPVYDAADGRITVTVTKDSLFSDLIVRLRVRQEAVRNGQHCLLRQFHGVGIGSSEPAGAWKQADRALDLCLEVVGKWWGDNFPEEAVEYREPVE